MVADWARTVLEQRVVPKREERGGGDEHLVGVKLALGGFKIRLALGWVWIRLTLTWLLTMLTEPSVSLDTSDAW